MTSINVQTSGRPTIQSSHHDRGDSLKTKINMEVNDLKNLRKPLSPLSTLLSRPVNPSIRVKNQVKRCFQPLHPLCIPLLGFSARLYQAQQVPRLTGVSRGEAEPGVYGAPRKAPPGSARLPPETDRGTPGLRAGTRLRISADQGPRPPLPGSCLITGDAAASRGRSQLLTCFCTSASLRAMATARRARWARSSSSA